MPFIYFVSFVGRQQPELVLELTETSSQSLRLYALPPGIIAEKVWDLMSPTVRTQYRLHDFDDYLDTLRTEHDILLTTLPVRRPELRLHTDFCKFLHPNMPGVRHPEDIAPGKSLEFTWAGGIIGSARIYEGTIASVKTDLVD